AGGRGHRIPSRHRGGGGTGRRRTHGDGVHRCARGRPGPGGDPRSARVAGPYRRARSARTHRRPGHRRAPGRAPGDGRTLRSPHRRERDADRGPHRPRRAAPPAHPPVVGRDRRRRDRRRTSGAHRRCTRRPARGRRDQGGGAVGTEPVGPADTGDRPTPALLSVRTWTDLPERTPLLLVPIGATEQHGPHLPLDTDTRIAVALAERAAARCDALLAPPIAYGASGEHEGFAGTISLGNEALARLVIEYGRSAHRWAARLLLVNGHGGNVSALAAAVTRLREEGRDTAWWTPVIEAGDAHAGRTETAMM